MKRISSQKRTENVLAVLKKLSGTDYCEEIETRRVEFDRFVRSLASRYRIRDAKALAKAIDFAARRYRDDDPLPKHELSILVKVVPSLVQVLKREGNEERVADLLVRREDAKIRGGIYDPSLHGQAIIAIASMTSVLSMLDARLRDAKRGGRRPNVGLHSAVGFLERYWRALPNRRLRRNFTAKDAQTGRVYAKSEAMRFAEDVMSFIDLAASSKLSSVTRHRLKRELPKRGEKRAPSVR